MSVMKARVCAYCTHAYIKPCDGSDPLCENKKHTDKLKAQHDEQTVHTEDQPTKEAEAS